MKEDHGFTVPLRTEDVLAGVDELRSVFGERATPVIERVRSHLVRATAARARGDVVGAVRAVEEAMSAVAALAASAVDPAEAERMRAVAAAFRTALVRGAEGEARQRLEEMLARSGAVKRERSGPQ